MGRITQLPSPWVETPGPGLAETNLWARYPEPRRRAYRGGETWRGRSPPGPSRDAWRLKIGIHPLRLLAARGSCPDANAPLARPPLDPGLRKFTKAEAQESAARSGGCQP